MAEKTMNVINGINIDVLNQAKEELRQNAELAQFKFIATNKWQNSMHSRATLQEFYQAGNKDETRQSPLNFDLDEPQALLGEDKGPNPVEYVLIGLSGCLTTALIVSAAGKGVHLKSVESRLEGELDVRGFLGIDKNIRNGYQNIKVIFKIDSDEPDSVIKELIRLAQASSPVFDIVTNKVPVSVGFEKK